MERRIRVQVGDGGCGAELVVAGCEERQPLLDADAASKLLGLVLNLQAPMALGEPAVVEQVDERGAALVRYHYGATYPEGYCPPPVHPLIREGIIPGNPLYYKE